MEAGGLAVLAVLATGATVSGLTLTTLVLVGRTPLVAGLLGWCERLAATMPWWVGLPAAGLLAAMLGGIVAVTLRYIRARPARGAPGVVVVDAPEPTAYSLGGRGGQIVASTGLLRQLTPDERRVVFAHEAAHLRLGHHRLLWVADVAALNPLLRLLRSRLRFLLERAADEEAARVVGDRLLVARTVGRVALLASEEAPERALAMNGGSVVGRVEALLAPDAVSRSASAATTGAGALFLGAALSASQWPRLAELVGHLCGL